MRIFNYSDILSLIAAIYKEAGKQEMYLKQRPEKLEKLVEIAGYRDKVYRTTSALPIRTAM